MLNHLNSSIAAKVQWSVQSLLLLVSIACAVSFYLSERDAIERGHEAKIRAVSDGVINGANMLMLNGIISDVEQRKLFIEKMSFSEHVKTLRIIRNALVQKQYGPGLPEEQPHGEQELQALRDGHDSFERQGNTLRGVIPYTASKNFRNTNCLQCHDVPEGYHNGASVIELDISAGNAKMKQLVWMSIGVTVAAQLMFFFFINYILRRFVSEPAGRMRTAIVGVSETRDFTRRVVVDSVDEIGQTARSFNDLMQNLQTVFRQVHDGIEQVAESSRSVSGASKCVASSSSTQSDVASAMAATVEEVTVSIAHVSDGAHEAVRLAKESGRHSDHGGEIIYRAVGEMKNIADTVRKTSVSIENLGESSRQISAIVNVIKGIAEQTNLLALNAAIEAARAGEQGRGFAVVADEVRKLAERTSNATQEVSQMINAIQDASRTAVSGMLVMVEQVDGGVDLAKQAGEAINQIKSESAQVIRTVDDISASLAEQSKASNEIAAQIERVAQMTEENSAAADETAGDASRLEELAGEMRNTVNRFKI